MNLTVVVFFQNVWSDLAVPAGSRGMQHLSAPVSQVSGVPRSARRSANPQLVAGAPAATYHRLKHVSSGRCRAFLVTCRVRIPSRRSANPQSAAGAPHSQATSIVRRH